MPESYRRFRALIVLFTALVVLSRLTLQAQVLAFPGAVGFGANATGGRGGTVYHVTTLADSGTGSFRDAVSQSGRIIVFDVGGYVSLQSAVTCANNLTIAGQTAPGGGIGLMGHEVSFSVRNNCIVRYLRFRPGSIASSTEDGINIGDATNMIFDHVSVEFAPYNNIDAHGNFTDGNQITFMNSILADPIGQQFNAHTEASNNTFSWIGNIFSSGHDRNPLAKVNNIFINNVIYNFQAGYTVADTGGIFSHDIINNYFITGPATTSANDDFFQFDANQSVYASGNLLDANNNGTLTGSSTAPGGVTTLSSPWSSLTPGIHTWSTAQTYHIDISASGAQPRDQVDQLIYNDVASLGTVGAGGGLWTSQSATGLGNSGYGVINGGVTPVDSDGDGMPDYWEEAVGLNPNSASDASTIGSDGYENIEHYLNWLASLHTVTATNTPVSIDLYQYTTGFTNYSPLYSVYNASNGAISLSSGHIVQFTPTANFSGLGSFYFTVQANDGSTYSNIVNVLMTPIAPPQNLVWQGDGVVNLWANGSGANWSNGSNLVAFASGDNVTFDDTGTNTPPVDLSGPIAAGTVYVVAQQNYTFAGSGYLSGGTVISKIGSGQLTLDTANTASGGTYLGEGVLQIGDGVTYNGGLAGSVTNEDTLIYATPGTLTSSVNISGPGTVTETGPGALTISGTETYTGGTTLNAGALTISGSLPPSPITDNGALTLAASTTQAYGYTISGSGPVTTSANGILFLIGSNSFAGNLTNTSGFLVLSNSSAAGQGTVVNVGGNVVAAAGIVITNNYSVPTSTADLNMMATNTGTGVWAGNVVNLGSSASWRPGSDGGTLMFVGTANQGSHNFIVPRGSVQFASNAVVSSTGGADAFGRDGSANNRSAVVTIQNNASVSLGVCSLGGGDQGGNVTLTVQNSATLSLTGNLDVQDVNRATAITFIRLNGGTLSLSGFAKTKTSQTNSINFNGGVLKAVAANSSFLPQFNFTTNAVSTSGAIIDDGGFAITIAAALNHDPAIGSAPDGGLTKLDTGTLTLTGVNTFSGQTAVNAGTLALSGSATLTSSPNIYIASGAVFDVSSSTASAYQTGVAKGVYGSGTVNGSFALPSGWILAPGSNNLGTLTFNNTLALSSGSRTILGINPVTATNSSLVVHGTLSSGGTLIVSNITTSPFSANESFQLFNATGYSGTFSSVQLPSLPFGLLWNTSALYTTGTISVMLNTTPAFTAVSITANGIGLSGTGGVGNAGYILLETTDLTVPASNWTRMLTNQFDSSGNFNFSTNAGFGQSQGFYMLQLQ